MLEGIKAIFIWNQKLGREECPYMRRWVIDLYFFSIRLHHWMASDDQRHYHDHPWDFISLILKGGYMDVNPDALEELKARFIELIRG